MLKFSGGNIGQQKAQLDSYNEKRDLNIVIEASKKDEQERQDKEFAIKLQNKEINRFNLEKTARKEQERQDLDRAIKASKETHRIETDKKLAVNLHRKEVASMSKEELRATSAYYKKQMMGGEEKSNFGKITELFF